MSVLYHRDKANVVADDLCHLSMQSVSHVGEGKRNLLKYVYRLDRLWFHIEDSSVGSVVIHHNFESSLVVYVMSKQHLDQALIELKESVLGKLNYSFFLGGMVS